MNSGVKIKTKPNINILIIFTVVFLLGLAGIIGFILVKETSVRVILLILGIVFLIISLLEVLGLCFNYEEIDNNMFIVHRLFKKKDSPINEIKSIIFTGYIVTIIDYNDNEICNIDPRKNGLISLLKHLEDNGAEYIEKINSNE